MTPEEYRARREAKIERAEQRSAHHAKASTAALAKAQGIGSVIPFGQPILVGHHSEGRHRRDLDRMHRAYERASDEQEKAEYYASKAERLANPTSISSDNPEAVQELRAKLARLEEQREHMKAANAYFRKHKTLEGAPIPDELKGEGLSTMRSWNGVYDAPFPPYTLQNLGGNIARIKQRIAVLEAASKQTTKEKERDGVTIREDLEENRLMLLFPGKPSEQARDVLKRNGFRWSPYNGAWQRQLNNAARYAADHALDTIRENGGFT